MTATSAISFDYTTIDHAAAASVKEHAEAIRLGLQTQLVAVIEEGQRLAEVKAALPHGSFREWIKAEFGWSVRTAERYITAAIAYGDNATHVSYLPLRTLYRLSAPSVPLDLRQEVLARCERGERPSAPEVHSLLAAAIEPRRAAVIEHRLAKARRRVAEAAEEWAAEITQRHRARKAADAAAKAAVNLIREAMPYQFDDLLALVREAGTWRFVNELAPVGAAAVLHREDEHAAA